MNFRSIIEHCMRRMQRGACETCDHREACVAAKWQQNFAFAGGAAPEERRAGGPSDPLSAFLTTLAEAFGRGREARSEDTKREVERRLEPLLASGDIGIDRIAREMGVSRQTLYRRLKAEGVTFEQVLDALRHRLALRYLRQGLSVKEAAYRLGFSEPASFSRAFKRWTGRSPSEI